MNTVAKIKEAGSTPVLPSETFEQAFVKLQAQIRPAIKDATNPAFRSKYADLGAVWEAVKGPLHENGFAIIQSPDFDGEQMWLSTTIMHVSGESRSGRYPLRPTKPDPQGFGSAITYARRYSISAMLGVIADEDDDGNAASASNGHAPAQPSTTPAKAQPYEDPDGQMKAWCDLQKGLIKGCNTVEDVRGWEESRADALGRLKRKNLPAWNDVRLAKEARIYEINTQESK